jgi:two-component system NtrC family sensor kinase
MVESAGYRLAWIGIASETLEQRVRPVAQSGFEEGALEMMRLAWSDADPTGSPAGKALQSGRPAVLRNIPQNPLFAHRAVEAATRGFASLIAVPFSISSSQRGILNIYAKEPDAFDPEEVKLLVKLADYLAYGLNALRTSIDRRKIEEELQREHDQAQLYLDVAGVLMVALDRQGTITLINAKGCSILARSQKEIVGLNWFTNFLPSSARNESMATYANLVSHKGQGFREYFEQTIIVNDTEKILAVHASLLHDKQGEITGMLFSGEDVTVKRQAETALRQSEENYRTLFDRMVSSKNALAAYRSSSEEGQSASTVANSSSPLADVHRP